MDSEGFDSLTRRLTAVDSRRKVMGGALGGSVALLGRVATDAGKKSQRKGRHGKKKTITICHQAQTLQVKKNGWQKRFSGASTGACQPSQPRQPRQSSIAASCPGPSEVGLGGGLRKAQTFQANVSGLLTRAEIELHHNPAGADFVLEIRTLDAQGIPATVLATTTVADVPETVWPTPRTLTGVFATPPAVVAGEWYALVITNTTTGNSVGGRESNPCEGQFYVDYWANEEWGEWYYDMIHAVFVTS